MKPENAPSQVGTSPTKLPTSSTFGMLTLSEIESLRRAGKETSDYARRVFRETE